MNLDKKLALIQSKIEKKNKKALQQSLDRSVSLNTVTKSNSLVRSYYRFSLIEKRCMESLISKLNPQRMDNDFQKIVLSASDYAKTFSVSNKTAYRDLKNAVSGLMGKVLSIPLQNREDYTLMASAKYKDGEGVIECQFNPLIVPHLAGLRKNFTSYPLSKAVSFSSSYSWRFYELLCSWSKPKSDTGGLICGWLDIEIHEFRLLLGIPDSYRWNNIQKQVLDVVVRELKQHASIHVLITPTKTVRTYTKLRIEFIEDDQLSLL